MTKLIFPCTWILLALCHCAAIEPKPKTSRARLDVPATDDSRAREGLSIPVYSHLAKLRDALSMTDLVVVGKASFQGRGRQTKGALTFDRVLFGQPHKTLRNGDGAIRLTQPFRIRAGQTGVWILLRTMRGYFVLNPSGSLLRMKEWETAKKQFSSALKRRNDLEEHHTATQLYRTYRDQRGGEVWHGCDVSLSDGVLVKIYEQGKSHVFLSWDGHGTLRDVSHRPKKGEGFSLSYHRGKLIAFYRFKDGKTDGLHCRWHRENPQQMKTSTLYQNGARHGRHREWSVNGKLLHDWTFDDGLLAPVVRYTGGKKSKAKMVRAGGMALYSAPRSLMDKIRVGMTSREVSQVLKLDFSETQGIYFHSYSIDSFLNVSFKDGKVAKRSQGHNGVCVRRR